MTSRATVFEGWNSPEASLEAARWTTQRREELLAQRAGIAFETVFSTDEKLDLIARAWQAHYFIRVFFVGTGDPESTQHVSLTESCREVTPFRSRRS